ncbi:RAV1 [Candida pseudojiufengensis]|uniref:RAV1 n=1 Tax=Candida pseudojiufengensis TaxID=497109 RepID=UPI0022254C9A|nr:RAV1 [Candida pseudojiufengensis]KAI5959053.1 RAV1 [Candida pseudojiufengensis]
MTITFVPGEVNKSSSSAIEATWKDHHIVAYGSGNNLIILTAKLTISQNGDKVISIDKNLQTIYLEKDLYAIGINSKNGFITIAYDCKLIIFKPIAEYMKIPKWVEIYQFNVTSKINCLEWAIEEDELVIGCEDDLFLYHIYEEFGEIHVYKRWEYKQPNPVTKICITPNSKLILTTSGCYDRLIKVWTRISYGDENTLFEVSYLSHSSYIKEFQWRKKSNNKQLQQKAIDSSMANIKKIRSYINSIDESEVIYSFTNNEFKVWASYETNGHNHISDWATLKLENVENILIIENYYLQDTLIPILRNNNNKLFEGLNLNDLDLLYTISKNGKIQLFTITNISQTPPNNIKFKLIKEFQFEILPYLNLRCNHDLTIEYIQSEEFITNYLNPIIFKKICKLPKVQALSFLIHDRIKNTLRYEIINFKKLPGESGITLFNKFQGHNKSIRKLVRSNSLYSTDNVLLSISNFGQYNFIWEPIILEYGIISITKRFQINVGENNQIWDSAIINDIEPPIGNKRRHLVIVSEKIGNISLWNCDGNVNDDLPADLIEKVDCSIVPKVFVLTEWPNDDPNIKQYCVVAIYSKDEIKSWKLILKYENKKIKDITFEEQKISSLPQDTEIFQIVRVDAFLNSPEKSLIAVIDESGYFESYTLDFDNNNEELKWISTYSLQTNIKNSKRINGSTVTGKLAILDDTGKKLTIWDTNQGVLEYEETFEEEVKDLDWTFINATTNFKSTTNAIYSIGFKRHVLLYTQLRYDYTNNIPTYAAIEKIDISDFTSHEIGDSIWFDDGYLVIGSGNQFFIDDRWVKLGSKTIDSTIRQLMSGYDQNSSSNEESRIDNQEQVYDIFYLVRVLNGPLPLYHPQFLIQALFMSQINIVHDILIKLFQLLRTDEIITWNLGIELDKSSYTRKRRLSTYKIDVFTKFNDELSKLLIDKLMKISLPLLTRHQQSTLISVILIVQQLGKFSIDDNGIRFMIGFKLFQLSTKQKSLSMRDINWALHSDNKEVLLNSIEDNYKQKLYWENVRKTKLVYWIKTPRLIKLIESIARNEFSESQDPSGLVSLFYLALRKKQILLGLWKIVNHQDKTKMIKFLNNDFSTNRWKSAALKNAFVLLGKHRYFDAAYFFLLGDKPFDCCSIIANKIGDISLSIAISKIYCGSLNINKQYDECLINIIERFILPKAIENGDRWTTSWIFWQIGEKQLSIQSLIKSPITIIEENQKIFSNLDLKNLQLSIKSQSFLNDDPVLILLYNELRNHKIDYLKGSKMINPIEEFETVIKVSMIYTRMGCDYLALYLLKNWSFPDYSTGKEINGNGKIKEEKDYDDAFMKNILNKDAPPAQAFEEPDMSSFNFGF